MIETIYVPTPAILVRLIAGGAAAVMVAVAARRGHALSGGGSAAAVACGAASAAAGWAWAALLVAYFTASSIVTAVGRRRKEARTAPIAEKGGERDGAQVGANGAAFCTAALATLALPEHSPWHTIFACAAIGALAASAADTWATEIGVLIGGAPRSIINRTVVRAGESGGVTWAGTLGGLAGAAFVVTVAVLLGLVHGRNTGGAPLALLVAGMIGSLLDSVLGATMQARRQCDACQALTERVVHTCGGSTRHVGGVAWIDNDIVNLAATLGGLVSGGALCAWWARG